VTRFLTRSRLVLLTPVLVAALLAAGPVLAAEEDAAAGPPDGGRGADWTRLSVTVREGGGPARHFELPLRLDGNVSTLHEGGQVALPNAQFPASPKEGVVPVTSFTYQNIGFDLRARARQAADGGIALSGDVKSTRVADGAAPGAPPSFTNYDQTFAVRLRPGATTKVVDRRGGSSGDFQVEVSLQR